MAEIFTVNIDNPLQYIESSEDIQNKMAANIVMCDSRDFATIKYIAGCDISFAKNDATQAGALLHKSTEISVESSIDAVASIVIFEKIDNKYNKIADVSINYRTNIPYKSGFLALRELPALLHLIEKIKQECPQYMPDIILIDGNGYWHPRRCGIATHFAILSGIPCIGVSKTVLFIDDITRDEVLKRQELGESKAGDMTDIITNGGDIIGSAFNTTGFIRSSSYISIGSGISLETAKCVVKNIYDAFGFKVIEPIRAADKLSRELLKKL